MEINNFLDINCKKLLILTNDNLYITNNEIADKLNIGKNAVSPLFYLIEERFGVEAFVSNGFNIAERRATRNTKCFGSSFSEKNGSIYPNLKYRTSINPIDLYLNDSEIYYLFNILPKIALKTNDEYCYTFISNLLSKIMPQLCNRTIERAKVNKENFKYNPRIEEYTKELSNPDDIENCLLYASKRGIILKAIIKGKEYPRFVSVQYKTNLVCVDNETQEIYSIDQIVGIWPNQWEEENI